MLLSIPPSAIDRRAGGQPTPVPSIKRADDGVSSPSLTANGAVLGSLPLQTIYDALLIADTSGRIRSANDRASLLLGFTREQLCMLNVGEVISGMDRNMIPVILDHIAKNEFVLIDGYGVRSDRSSFPTETVAGRISHNDTEHICFFVRDVTRRKETEQKAKQSAKLRSLHMLAGGVAHDISNLLTAVIGHLELGLASLPDGLKNNPDLLSALANARKMSSLSYRMRAFSGKGVLRESSVDLNGIIRETGDKLADQVADNIFLNIRPHSEPVNANGEEDLLETVAENLLWNSVEAIGKSRGTVTISCSVKTLDASFIKMQSLENDLKPGTYACLEVSDTGCGIDKVTLESIFEPFLTTKGEGRGLGLAEVQGIVTTLGGATKVDTEVGKGSTFTVYLPLAEAKAPSASAPTASASAPQQISAPVRTVVLVIDDDESIRRYLDRVLKINGFSVFLAENGKDGIQSFRAHADEVDMVLLDMIMPDATGDKVLRQLREIRKNIKVLLITGYTDRMDPDLFAAAEPTGVIHKPFSTSDFLATLKAALASESAS